MPSLGTPVERLLGGCRPSDISGFVASIVIDAVDRHPWRRFTHISEEVFEGQPTIADGDSSSAIMVKMAIIEVSATLNHRCPTSVNRRSTPSRRMSVFSVASDEFVSVGASAADSTSAKIGPGDANFFSTIAAAFFSFVALITYGGQAAKAAAGKVDESHAPLYSILSLTGQSHA